MDLQQNQQATGESSWKPMIGVIIIVAVLALGGYYMWKTQVQSVIPPPSTEEVAE
jgi:hypothetical protein